MLDFGEYLPDVAPLENPGLVNAKNILPGSAGYQPVPGPSQISTNAMDARAQGGGSFRAQDNTDTIYTFIGNRTKIYDFAVTTFTDVSIAAGYTTAAEDSWEFAQWDDQVVATNFTDPMQVITLGAPPFANLGGSPPNARHLAVVDNFLVVGNTYDVADGYQPARVRWAGIGTITQWAVSATTQADFQNLRNDAGYIQKIIGGDVGYIFQERAITKMSYIGSPLVFQFDEIETARGALAANSVIKVGNNVAYLAQDGFFVFDGQQSIPIGDGKVDETFFNTVDITLLDRMTVALYPNENIICWSYASLTAMGQVPDTILLYNYAPNSKQKWSYANIDTYLLLNPISTAYTLDGLDAVSTNLDTLPFSLDSKVWQGSINLLGIITPTFNLSLLNSTPLNATIETGEAWLQEPKRTFISLIRPHIDASSNSGVTITAQIAARNLEYEDISYGPACSLNSAGFIPVRANARFMRAQFNLTGAFRDAQGFDIISTTPVGRQ